MGAAVFPAVGPMAEVDSMAVAAATAAVIAEGHKGRMPKLGEWGVFVR